MVSYIDEQVYIYDHPLWVAWVKYIFVRVIPYLLVGLLFVGITIIFPVALWFHVGRITTWVAENIYTITSRITGWAFVVSLLIALPLAIPKAIRPWSGVVFVLASLIFALHLWLSCFLTLVSIWGKVGVVIGVFLLGIGVIPLSLIASLLTGSWKVFGGLLLLVIITYAMNQVGIKFLVAKQPY